MSQDTRAQQARAITHAEGQIIYAAYPSVLAECREHAVRFPVLLCEYARGLANSTTLLLDKYDVKPTPGVAAIRRAYDL